MKIFAKICYTEQLMNYPKFAQGTKCITTKNVIIHDLFLNNCLLIGIESHADVDTEYTAYWLTWPQVPQYMMAGVSQVASAN